MRIALIHANDGSDALVCPRFDRRRVVEEYLAVVRSVVDRFVGRRGRRG